MAYEPLKKTPLPVLDNTGASFLDNADETYDMTARSAYQICYDLERDVIQSNRNLMHARILGYLLIHAPSRLAVQEVARVIISCSGNQEKLLQLGELFVVQFVRGFRKQKGRTPQSSSHPSRLSVDKDRDELMKVIEEAPKNHQEAKKQALIRDSFRCIATGWYDRKTVQDYPEVFDPEDLENARETPTECAHIVPQSTFHGLTDETKRNYTSSVLAVLQRFGLSVETLNGENIHSLYNIMTLSLEVHDAFDTLLLWFEFQGNDTYLIKTKQRFCGDVRKKITFSTPDSEKLPVPSPQLLGLHAACVKVANLSGAAEYIDSIDQEMDNYSHRVLSSDGTSAHVLQNAIDACTFMHR